MVSEDIWIGCMMTPHPSPLSHAGMVKTEAMSAWMQGEADKQAVSFEVAQVGDHPGLGPGG